MTLLEADASPQKPHDSYRHEALLYRGDDEFVAGTVPFIRGGLDASQPVMVVVIAPKIERLRVELGNDADRVEFVDMAALGGNPARIIPAWREFVDANAVNGQPMRGIGEPIWAGRRAPEVLECQLHEALLNLAVDPDTPLWLRCPYDVSALEGDILAEAERSHPVLVDEEAYTGSTLYGGIHHASAAFDHELAEPTVAVVELAFDASGLPAVRDVVTGRATLLELDVDKVSDLALAMHELATNSLRHGGGRGVLRVWQEPDALVCEIHDAGRVEDPLVGRRVPPPRQEGGRGVWMANNLCDLVQMRSSGAGTTVRVLTWL
ncbi:MAG: sensor histidine kinase [Sporichthyaceae bacterium]